MVRSLPLNIQIDLNFVLFVSLASSDCSAAPKKRVFREVDFFEPQGYDPTMRTDVLLYSTVALLGPPAPAKAAQEDRPSPARMPR